MSCRFKTLEILRALPALDDLDALQVEMDPLWMISWRAAWTRPK